MVRKSQCWIAAVSLQLQERFRKIVNHRSMSVFVQGDTTTAAMIAHALYNMKILVIRIELGLHEFNLLI